LEDYASAAARHWDNAQFLGDDNRWQEAAYLAGYIAECSLKALLERTAPDILLQLLGHNLVALTGEALEMAALLNPTSRRYPVATLSPGTPGVSRWKPEHRYERTGFLTDREFQQIVAEAQLVGRSVLIELMLDGIVEEISL
jgi:hypothetical protein